MLRERDVVERVGRVTVKRLRVWVERGWVKPARKGRSAVFSDTDVARAALICDLSDVLELQEDSVPMVLHLIDQIHGLRHELKMLISVIDALPQSVRDDIKARIAALE